MVNGSRRDLHLARARMTDLEEDARASSPHCPWINAVKALQSAAMDPKWPSYRSLAQILVQHMDWAGCRTDDARSIFLQLVLFRAATEVVDGTMVPAIELPDSIRQLLVNE